VRIIDFFDQGVSYHGSNVAFVDPSSSYTYDEADSQVHKISAAIVGNGFAKGTRIGVYSPNSNDAWLALLGLMRVDQLGELVTRDLVKQLTEHTGGLYHEMALRGCVMNQVLST
jgi:acyl-coenzyme A synthetase/AMP-(fatty) acid ligase